MVEIVTAETFVKKTVGGHATEPVILLCRRGNALVDVFTKVSWANCPPSCLAAELLASRLARDLGFNVPESVLVSFDDDFVNALALAQPLLAGRFRDSVRPAVGSIRLPNGYSDAATISDEIPRRTLAEAWAFDRLILNADRRAGKPNCLTNGTDIALIDHEKALNCELIGTMMSPYPWAPGEIAATDVRAPHLFRPYIHGQGDTLDALEHAWNALGDGHFADYATLIPDSWHFDARRLAGMISYLQLLRANLEQSFAELRQAIG